MKNTNRCCQGVKPANVPKVLSAPVTAILALIRNFWKELLRLFPPRRSPWPFSEKPPMQIPHIATAPARGISMIAARALGLDVGPISGFDNSVIDAEFFNGTTLKSNFLCNVGYGDETALFQRLPRFDFDDVCEIL
ncbi:UNVERIFIED_CONTAM: hypothetical protein GTU68_013145 [Idotea baltica]|nr:hypothetical protein [Idotea baltica]